MLWEKSIFFQDSEYDLLNVRFQFSTIRPTMYKKRVTLKIEDFLDLCLIGIRRKKLLVSFEYTPVKQYAFTINTHLLFHVLKIRV